VDAADLNEHTRANLHPVDEGFDRFLWMQQRVKVERIVRCLERLGVSGRLADVGCATGALTEAYAKLPGVRELHGFDFNDVCLERAAARGIVPHRWNMDAEPCPAEDAAFDAIVASDIIEHLVNSDRFVIELRRVLRPGGRLVVTTPNLAFWWSRIRLLRGRVPWLYPGPSSTVRIDPNQAVDHIRIQTEAAWRALFEHHRLQVVAVEGYPPSAPDAPRLRDWIFLTLDRVLAIRPSLCYGLLFVLSRGEEGGE
jgi:2-polyprenyl-3-methyl-5-hydroxy-6-metoxy-1,4-benzoquinol methylase